MAYVLVGPLGCIALLRWLYRTIAVLYGKRGNFNAGVG